MMKKHFLAGALLATIYLTAQNTGIGTTAPLTTLDVRGVIRSSKMPINTTAYIYNGQSTTFTPVNTLVTDTNGVIGYLTGLPSMVNPTGFEKITQSGNSGWRLIGAVTSNYGMIGRNAVDASFSNIAGQFGATGYNSFAAGLRNIASGDSSVTFGTNNTSSGNGALTYGHIGFSSTATNNNIASGESSLAGGYQNFASGKYSLAIGNNSKAEGDNSVALGFQSNAKGWGSVALLNGLASNVFSFSVMSNSNAKGQEGIALGSYVISQALREIAVGFANTRYTPIYGTDAFYSNRQFVVGNGSNSLNIDYTYSPQSYSDAFTILKNGQVGIGYDNYETMYDSQINNSSGDNSKKTRVDINGSMNLAAQSITVGGTCKAGTIAYGTDDNFYGCKSTGWVLLNN